MTCGIWKGRETAVTVTHELLYHKLLLIENAIACVMNCWTPLNVLAYSPVLQTTLVSFCEGLTIVSDPLVSGLILGKQSFLGHISVCILLATTFSSLRLFSSYVT